MKVLGLIVLAIGVIWAMIAFNLGTTVETGGQTIGSGEYAITVPRATVSNIGLMDDRRNQLLFSGLTVLVGVLLFCFGSMKPSIPKPAVKYQPCPKCQRENVVTASICRFCQSPMPKFRESTKGANNLNVTQGVAEQIERLAKLKSDGAITEQEFLSAKEKVLS